MNAMITYLNQELGRAEIYAVNAHKANDAIIADGEEGYWDVGLSWAIEEQCPAVFQLLAQWGPQEVLNHVNSSREILAEHPDELGFCPRCADDLDWTATPARRKSLEYPCPTVRLVAEMWGWTEET